MYISTDSSYLIKWWAGGAPSPPGFQVSKKKVWICGSRTLPQFVQIGHIYQWWKWDRQASRESETTAKKQKIPTLPQKSQKPKVVRKKWKSRPRLFRKSATQKKIWKKFRTNEEDFRCVPKKTNNAKKSAMKFRNINIWMVRYLAGHVASPNQQSVLKSVHNWIN